MSDTNPAIDDKRLSDDLIIGLIFKGDAVLYSISGKKKDFPDFKMARPTTDAQKTGQLRGFIRDELGLEASSVELLAHIQKDPRDIMQYFINAHIYIYRVTVPPDQFAALPAGAAETGWHDLTAGQEEGFSYKGKLMLDFLRDWTIPDFQRLDAKDVRDWYNAWLAKYLKDAYREYVDQEIDQCKAEDVCFINEIEQVVKPGDQEQARALEDEVETVFPESQQLADLIASTTAGAGPGASAPAPGAPPAAPDLQLAALNKIKDHLCLRLYGLKDSRLNEREARVAYRLMGHLLKRTNELLDKYAAEGVQPGYDFELKTLVSELESESLSPFDQRRG